MLQKKRKVMEKSRVKEKVATKSLSKRPKAKIKRTQKNKRGFGTGMSDRHFVRIQPRKTTPKLPSRGSPTQVTLDCTLTFSLG